MKIQIVSKYLTLATEGLVQKMDCPLCQGLLMPNQDIDDIIYLYCLSCQYKNNIGIAEYERIEKAVTGN